MTPEELDRVLDRMRTTRSGYGWAYFIALLMIAIIAILIYGWP